MSRPLVCLLFLIGCASEPTPAAPTPTPTPTPDADVAASPDIAAPPQCTPGVRQTVCASPTSVTRCASDGSGWEEAACPSGERCYQGQCVDYPCPPGAIECTGPKTVSACLALDAGGYGWKLMETCEGLCQDGACVPQCDFLVKQNLGKACEHFVVELTGTSPGDCPDPGLIAVPSSAVDQIVVFDVDAAPPAPVAGSPFDTCDDPSRILLTTEGHVIATCRGDGRVVRHAPGGEVLWDVTLPACQAARGIALRADGRLFAGCTNTGNVHEIDPDTGAVLHTADSGVMVYGLTSDATGVYAMDVLALVKLEVDPTLSVAWTVDANGYGIAADAQGRIWLSASPGLVAYSAQDGAVVDEVPIEAVLNASPDLDTAGCNGVAVAADGRVLAGCADVGNLIAAWDPEAGLLEEHPLPAGDDHPRGVSADVAGNLYSINRESNTVTRVDATTGAATSFGADLLTDPYGYSGDLTAVGACLDGGAPTQWKSPVIDRGEETTWVAVEWEATVPPGTSLEMGWRVDGGPWTPATNGGPIGVTGQTFQVRAILTGDGETGPTLEDVAVFYE